MRPSQSTLRALLVLLLLPLGSLRAQDTAAAAKPADPDALSPPATYRLLFPERENCRIATWLHLSNRTGHRVRVSIGRRVLGTAPASERDWPVRVPDELLEDLIGRGVTVQGVGAPTPSEALLTFSLSCNR